jgi:hypothetical protein
LAGALPTNADIDAAFSKAFKNDPSRGKSPQLRQEYR